MIGGHHAEHDVKAVDHCFFDVDGLVRFDAAGGGDGDFRLICSTISATYAGSFGLFDGLVAPIVDDLTDNPAVRTAFDILLAERSSPDIGTSGVTEAVMKLSLILLVRSHLKRGLLSSPLFASLGDSRMANAVGLVLKEPGADLALADLAAAAGMSRSAFAKAFQSTFDQTPMEFVQKTRLHHAADLLATTDLPVKVIAASLGFASRSHFSRTFRRAYHTDPTRYRERHTGETADVAETVAEA